MAETPIGNATDEDMNKHVDSIVAQLIESKKSRLEVEIVDQVVRPFLLMLNRECISASVMPEDFQTVMNWANALMFAETIMVSIRRDDLDALYQRVNILMANYGAMVDRMLQSNVPEIKFDRLMAKGAKH